MQRVVNNVSFSIGEGEIVGLVGESGSGKSVTSLSILGLLPRDSARVEGKIMIDDVDLLRLDERALSKVRGSSISMIFQEPMNALDPVFSIGYQLVATYRSHHSVTKAVARRRALEMMRAVGLSDPERRFEQYPHQLSGGMRQRVVIAMALICEPDFLIADEPTTALDVTIESQILELIKEINREFGTAVLLVSHDLGVIARACDRVITMYAGEVVETASVDEILLDPQHPYTSGLIRSLPTSGTNDEELYAIPGRVAAPGELSNSCLFYPRCEYAESACSEQVIELVELTADRRARCRRSDELSLQGVIL